MKNWKGIDVVAAAVTKCAVKANDTEQKEKTKQKKTKSPTEVRNRPQW